MIKSEKHAHRHAAASLKGNKKPIDTLVVSQSGDVFANCDVTETVTKLKKAKQNYYILKGTVKSKKDSE